MLIKIGSMYVWEFQSILLSHFEPVLDNTWKIKPKKTYPERWSRNQLTFCCQKTKFVALDYVIPCPC